MTVDLHPNRLRLEGALAVIEALSLAGALIDSAGYVLGKTNQLNGAERIVQVGASRLSFSDSKTQDAYRSALERLRSGVPHATFVIRSKASKGIQLGSLRRLGIPNAHGLFLLTLSSASTLRIPSAGLLKESLA